jgi:cytochrome c oxidase cbb3-type subunit III
MPGSTRVRTAAFALTAFSTVTALVAFAATATPPPKGNAEAAKAIFTTKCIVCHKADGTGGVKLTGNPTPNWKDPKTWADPKRAKDDYFRDCITNGKPASGMVAWGKTGQIKPADIENLIAYIHTLKSPKTAAATKTATTAKPAETPAKTSSK